ncbi:MAG: 4Fe-4S binding protein [bacterium]|nr:4Fe-4S binding protein [bacterium]
MKKVMPKGDRLERGPCVILECFEQIPCNPCVDVCPHGAIKIEGNINNIPIVDFEKCNGCGICISSCPGLAVFVIHPNYSETYGLVMLPYEFLPVPKPGDIVDGLSREGKKVCNAKVVRVLLTKKQDRTAIISITVPKNLVMEVRNISVPNP